MFDNIGIKLIISLLSAAAISIFKKFIENDLIFAVFSGILLLMMLIAYSYVENKKKRGK